MKGVMQAMWKQKTHPGPTLSRVKYCEQASTKD